ncbi:MAG: energy transducer TonB [Acidobacteria bacterium]|nr:energy transducer TonB [Acidobacteriota bacterium]
MLGTPLFALPASQKNSRARSVLLSFAIHGAAILLLVKAGPGRRLAADPTPYRELIAGQERKLVWYSGTLELPPVAPAEATPAPNRPGQFYARQAMAATAPKPESHRQMVLQAAPELHLERDVVSPNVLIFNPPPPPVPPAPKPRFVPTVKPRYDPRTLPEAEAPRLAAAASTPALPAGLGPSRMPAPRFQMPARERASHPQALPSVDAPQLALAIPKDSAVAPLAPRLAVPARPQFVMPERGGSSRRTAGAGNGPALAGLPLPDIAAARQPSAVIVGLDPAPGPVPPPPPGNRSAQFSGDPGEKLGNGIGGVAAERAEIRVPNLAVAAAAADPSALTGPAPAAPPPLPARPAVDRSLFRRELLASITKPPIGLPQANLPAPPDLPRGVLHGSTVYSLAIDMPNITSYEGSWTLRFTELGGSSPEDLLTAPVAMRKVDPKYIASAAAEGVEGKIMLYAVIRRDGRVDQIRLIQGLDERLNSSAVSAFSKWEFQPATKNGQPVDLEALVQIPFRLEHRKKN